MRSTRYIRIKLEIEHPENITPEKVMDEMNFEFKSTIPGSEIVDTDIDDYEKPD